MDRKAIAIVAMGMPLQSAYRCRAPGLRFAYSAATIAVPPTHTKFNSGDTATATLAKFSRPLEAPLWTLSVSALTACLYVTPAK